MILSMATAPYFFQMGKNLQEISNWTQQKAQAFFNAWTVEKCVAGGLITRKLDEKIQTQMIICTYISKIFKFYFPFYFVKFYLLNISLENIL